MRRSLAGAVVAASVAAGGLAGGVLGVPSLAGAAEAPSGAVSWIDEALSGLVGDGTITQGQADAVEAALAEARPAHGHRHWRLALDAAADALGLGEDAVRQALRDGQTLAELAASRGVEVQAVVDALVAEAAEQLRSAVDAGRLTQEEADARLAEASRRAGDLVAGEIPLRHHRHGHHGRGLWDGPGDGGGDGTTEGSGTTEGATA